MIRFLDDPPLDGATNMARDEALLIGVGRGNAPPTLRLYRWNPPTISLGYFQPYAEYRSLPPPAGDLAVVRRLTGGGAILHDLELTYSLTLPLRHALLANGPNSLYELAHDAVIECIREIVPSAARCGWSDGSGAARGPFFCFARRHCFDILAESEKLAGSAQRRTREAVLQHGSIVLANRYPQQPTASISLPFERAVEQVRAGFPKCFSRRAGLSLEHGTWTSEESTATERLRMKYEGMDWTART